VSEEDQELLILVLVSKYRKLSGDAVEELVAEQTKLSNKREKLDRTFQKKNKEMKKKDRDQLASQQWSMIRTMKFYLLGYALLDATI